MMKYTSAYYCFGNKMIVPSIPEHVSWLVPSVHWCSVQCWWTLGSSCQQQSSTTPHQPGLLGWDTGTTQGKESDVRTDEKLLNAVLWQREPCMFVLLSIGVQKYTFQMGEWFEVIYSLWDICEQRPESKHMCICSPFRTRHIHREWRRARRATTGRACWTPASWTPTSRSWPSSSGPSPPPPRAPPPILQWLSSAVTTPGLSSDPRNQL